MKLSLFQRHAYWLVLVLAVVCPCAFAQLSRLSCSGSIADVGSSCVATSTLDKRWESVGNAVCIGSVLLPFISVTACDVHLKDAYLILQPAGACICQQAIFFPNHIQRHVSALTPNTRTVYPRWFDVFGRLGNRYTLEGLDFIVIVRKVTSHVFRLAVALNFLDP